MNETPTKKPKKHYGGFARTELSFYPSTQRLLFLTVLYTKVHTSCEQEQNSLCPYRVFYYVSTRSF